MLLEFIIKVLTLLYTLKINNLCDFIQASEQFEETTMNEETKVIEYEQFLSTLYTDELKLREVLKEISITIGKQASINSTLKDKFAERFIKFHLFQKETNDYRYFILLEMKEIYQMNNNLLPEIVQFLYDILLQYKDYERIKINMSKFVSFLEILNEIKNTTVLSNRYNLAKRKYILHSYKPDKVFDFICKQINEVVSKLISMERCIDVILVYQKLANNCYKDQADKENTISDILFVTQILITFLDSMSFFLDDIIKFKKMPSNDVFVSINDICKRTSFSVKEELSHEIPNYSKIYGSKNLGTVYQMISLFLDLVSYTLNNYTDEELDDILQKAGIQSEKVSMVRQKIRYMSCIDIFSNSNAFINILHKAIMTFVEFYKNEEPSKELFQNNIFEICGLLVEDLDTLGVFGGHIKMLLNK